MSDEQIDRHTERLVVLQEVQREGNRACAKWPAFHSPHEGYAVILEELDELWELVKARRFDPAAARAEAVQVAAMAVRFAAELCAEKVDA